MTPCFADTYFFIALLSRADAGHEQAVNMIEEIGTNIVTSVWVLVEVADGMCLPRSRPTFRRLIEMIDSEPWLSVLPFDQMVFDEAMKLYFDRPDKEWSLTDCTSFVLMNRLGIFEALTADHHFDQAGFVALMK